MRAQKNRLKVNGKSLLAFLSTYLVFDANLNRQYTHSYKILKQQGEKERKIRSVKLNEERTLQREERPIKRSQEETVRWAGRPNVSKRMKK